MRQCAPVVAALFISQLNAGDTPKVRRLTLKQAIESALAPGVAPLQISETGVDTARQKMAEAKAATALLAQGLISDRIFIVDLRSLGIDAEQLPLANGPYAIPFALLTSRIVAAKTLIDRSAARKVTAANKQIEEAKSAVREERERIAAETARVYFEAVRASELMELARQNVKMAETLRRFAEERLANGLDTDAGLRGAKARMDSELQKLSAARLDQTRAVLRLLYLLGGEFADSLELVDPLARREFK